MRGEPWQGLASPTTMKWLRLSLLGTAMAWAGSGAVAHASGLSPCPGLQWHDSEQATSVFVSPYTHHWRHAENHRPVALVGVVRHLPGDRACGASLFSNSFGQPSAYAFTAWEWPRLSARRPQWYASLSAGILYGYVEPYQNKVPLNVRGFSPGVIPALGYRLTEGRSAEVHVLGTAALMFGLSQRF
jgi:hypothetical protein